MILLEFFMNFFVKKKRKVFAITRNRISVFSLGGGGAFFFYRKTLLSHFRFSSRFMLFFI